MAQIVPFCAFSRVFSGVVMNATCNCIPTAPSEDNISICLDCIECLYLQGSVTCNIVTRGECHTGYRNKPLCSALKSEIRGKTLCSEGCLCAFECFVACNKSQEFLRHVCMG